MVAEDRLLLNGVTCPARTLDRLSNKDVIVPAKVMLEPLSNTAIAHIFLNRYIGPSMKMTEVLQQLEWRSLYPVQVSDNIQ